MRPVLLALFALGAVGVVGIDACKGCAPECSPPKNEGAETCPCQSDQDCTTKLGIVLLCVDGTCTRGNPDDVAGPKCTADSDCGNGNACGIDQFCLPAPKCQRIDATSLQARRVGEAAVAAVVVTSSRDDCLHHWSATSGARSFDVSVTNIDLQGQMTLDPALSGGCTGGNWFAPERIGELDCGSDTWLIGPADVIAASCTDDPACRQCGGSLVGAHAGVCG